MVDNLPFPQSRGDILVVGEPLDPLRFLIGELAAAGYAIREAITGEMALCGARSTPPDWILVDLGCLGIDGEELWRQLQGSPVTRDIPVIVLNCQPDSHTMPPSAEPAALAAAEANCASQPTQIEGIQPCIQHQPDLCRFRAELHALKSDWEDRAQQTAQLQAQLERERGLNQVLQALPKQHSLSELCAVAALEVGQLLQLEHVEIVRYRPQESLWQTESHYCRDPHAQRSGLEMLERKGPLAVLIEQLPSASIRDIRLYQSLWRLPNRCPLPGAWLLLPLQGEAGVWGCAILMRQGGTSVWTTADLELAEISIAHCAAAIRQLERQDRLARHNVALQRQLEHLTERFRQAMRFETTLSRIANEMSNSLDQEQIVQTAVREVTLALGVQSCNAGLYDLQKRRAQVAYEFSTSTYCYRDRSIDMDARPDVYNQLLRGQSFQFCPLQADGRSTGMAKLAYPIASDDEIVGDFWAIRAAAEPFDELEERLVAQVTDQCAIALRQSRLYQAVRRRSDELEELNRLKDDFVSTVSHELRSPIANVRMALTLMRTIPSESKREQYYDLALNECNRQIELVGDLLDLQRLEASKYVFTIEPIDLQSCVAEMLLAIEAEAAHKQQHLTANLPPIQLECDRVCLIRMLRELLHNAIKYTAPGGEIIFTAAEVDERVSLKIRNLGELPPEALPRLFEKFYRARSSDRWQHGGTGLGLALVKQMVAQLHGDIQAANEGGWVTFALQLPKAQPPLTAVTEPLP